MYQCLQENSIRVRQLFFSLPDLLYPPEKQIQDRKTEEQILLGTHPLSSDFSIRPFVVIDGENTPVCRCILTEYPEDPKGYVGFFESQKDEAAVKLMLDQVAALAKSHGKTSLCGPFDGSFWIRYRFKTNNFEEFFTGEPMNPDYYVSLWEANGFQVTDHYFSNHLRIPVKEDRIEKSIRRWNMFLERGFEIRSTTFRSFPQDLKQIYRMLIDLYASFPGFKFITEEQFVSLFSYLRYVLNYDMVKLVSDETGQLAGFMICVPNYGYAASGKLSLKKFRKILSIKKGPSEYVIPYMGVYPKYAGLGSALSEQIKRDLEERECRSIGALIHDGKVSGNYYKQLTTHLSEYVLMEKALT